MSDRSWEKYVRSPKQYNYNSTFNRRNFISFNLHIHLGANSISIADIHKNFSAQEIQWQVLKVAIFVLVYHDVDFKLFGTLKTYAQNEAFLGLS